MKVTQQKQLEIYETIDGKKPFIEWLDSVKDKSVRYRIKERLDRISLGNLGDHKVVRDGVSELRFTFGAGYRVYYAEENNKIILLLCGGDKSSQKQDIKEAVAYWQDYLSR